jgi:hypothetical protein
MANNAQLVVAERKITPLPADDKTDYGWRTEKSHHCQLTNKIDYRMKTVWLTYCWIVMNIIESLINHRLVETYSQQHKTSGGQTLGELSNISIVRYTYVSEYGETTHHDFEPRSVQTNTKIQPIDKTSVHVTIPNSLHSHCQHLTIFQKLCQPNATMPFIG